MSLERALGATLRNFSTFFLVVLVVTLPVNLAYSVVFRDVIATGAFHDEIEALGDDVAVPGVDAGAIRTARVAWWVVVLLQVASVPLLVAASRRVLQDDSEDRVPTVTRAYRRLFDKVRREPRRAEASALLGGAAVGALVWFLGYRIGALASEALPRSAAFAGFGLTWALSLALGAPFAILPLALVRSRTTRPEGSAI